MNCDYRLLLLFSHSDVFLELSGFFCDLVDVGNLISGSSAFSKFSLNVWKFTVHSNRGTCSKGREKIESGRRNKWSEYRPSTLDRFQDSDCKDDQTLGRRMDAQSEKLKDFNKAGKPTEYKKQHKL